MHSTKFNALIEAITYTAVGGLATDNLFIAQNLNQALDLRQRFLNVSMIEAEDAVEASSATITQLVSLASMSFDDEARSATIYALFCSILKSFVR